jgi:hypothetical protein
MIGLIVVAGTAFGQDGERGGRDRRGGDRGGWDRGDRGGRGGWDRGAWMDRFVEQLKVEVGLDDAQMTEVRKIVTAHQSEAGDDRAAWEEMREAMQNGDRELAAELREQMMSRRGEREAAMGAALDEIETVLTDDQLESYGTFRQRMDRRREEGRQRGESMRQIFTLPDTLEMSDEQRDEFRTLIDEQRESMRQRWQDRQAAAESGETDGQGRERDRGPGGPPAFFDKAFFTAVDGILNDNQREQFAKIRAEFEAGGQGPAGDRRRDDRREPDLRTMLEASRRVPALTTDQRDALKQISSEAMRAFKELRGESDKEGLALLTEQTKAEIEKVLTEEQAEVFDARLSRERGDRDRTDRARRPKGDDGATEPKKKGKGKGETKAKRGQP